MISVIQLSGVGEYSVLLWHVTRTYQKLVRAGRI